MGNTIVFSAIKTNADNRVLEQDENGYYKVTLGAINALNEAGQLYLADGVNDLITNQSNTLARRLKAGYLKGESGHPRLEIGMTKSDYYARNLRVELNNVSHHIRDIMLTPTNKPTGIGTSNIILVEAWIKPSGPKGDALKKALDNPDENVAFSIRSFTQDTLVNGITHKKLLQIVTWDWVLEPGIKLANKFDKLSVESLELCSFESDELVSAGAINECINCSLESADEVSMTRELIEHSNIANTDYGLIHKW